MHPCTTWCLTASTEDDAIPSASRLGDDLWYGRRGWLVVPMLWCLYQGLIRGHLVTVSMLYFSYFLCADISAVVSSAMHLRTVTPPPAPQIKAPVLSPMYQCASFNYRQSADPLLRDTRCYYVFLEASEAAVQLRQVLIRDHNYGTSVNVLIPTIPPSGTALTHTFSGIGHVQAAMSYFSDADTGGFRSDVTSSSNTIDVTVASSDFLCLVLT